MSGLRPVSTGTQKVTMNESERDYRSQRKAAEAQASNPYVSGIQEVFKQGAGTEVSKSRTNYGAVTEMPENVLEGENSNFAQPGDAGNNPNADPRNTTGNLDNEVSATTVPQDNVSDFQSDALAKRIEMMRGTMPQSHVSLNDRAETMRG